MARKKYSTMGVKKTLAMLTPKGMHKYTVHTCNLHMSTPQILLRIIEVKSYNYNSYLTVIGVHELYGWMHPNYCQITIFVGSWPLFIIGLLPTNCNVRVPVCTFTCLYVLVHVYPHDISCIATSICMRWPYVWGVRRVCSTNCKTSAKSSLSLRLLQLSGST